LLLGEIQEVECTRKYSIPLHITRSFESEYFRGTSFYRRIERTNTVGTHDNCCRKLPAGKTVDAPNKSIYAGAILVMHLGGLA